MLSGSRRNLQAIVPSVADDVTGVLPVAFG